MQSDGIFELKMSLLILSTLLLATSIATIYIYLKFVFSFWKRRGVPFIEPSIPFGNFTPFFKFKKTFGQNIHELYNQSNAPVVGVYAALRPALLIRDPKTIRDILIKDFQYFSHRGFHYDESVDPLTRNLFSQSGDQWKEMRAKLSAAFTSGKLKGMVETIIDCGKKLEDRLDRYAAVGKEVEVHELFAQFTTNVTASVGFGLDVDCIENPKHEFRECAGRIFAPLKRNVIRFHMSYVSPFLTKLFGCRFADKDVEDFMIETVRQNLQYREKNDVVRKDFFQLLIQLRNTGKVQDDDDDWDAKMSNEKKSLTLEDLTAQAYIFFIAAYESSSTTMSFCLHELAKRPNLQQKVYDEITSVLHRHNGKLNYDSLSEMKYLEACVDGMTETSRQYFCVFYRNFSRNPADASTVRCDYATVHQRLQNC